MATKKQSGYGLRIKSFQKTELPPSVIVSLKALFLYVFLIHWGVFVNAIGHFPYLPFLTFLDSVPSFVFSIAIAFLFLSVLAVTFKKGNYRVLSLTSGLIILVLILSSKPLFSNSFTFVACLLVLIGLVKEDSFIFRIQISLLYLGAAINKIFDPDWWNGHYFDFFLRDAFDITLYQSWIPTENMTVAKTLGITTIFSELMLGIIVLIPKLTRITIILGLIFHGAMLVITSGQLSARFLYIMSVAFLLISNIKIKPIHVEHCSRFLTTFLNYLDLSDSLILTTSKDSSFSITFNKVKFTEWKAFWRLLFSSQFLITFYFLSIILYMITPVLLNKLLFPLF